MFYYCTEQSEQSLKTHTRTNHRTASTVLCEYCGDQYTSQFILNVHIVRQHLNVDLNLSCNICGKRFRTKLNLRNHKTSFHKYANKFKCDTCGMGFYKKNRLKLHVLAKHEGKRYDCIYPECSNAMQSASIGMH